MALSLNEGILFGDELGDVAGVLFQGGVGGDGGGELDVPVSFCIAVASDCDIEIGWDFVVDFDVLQSSGFISFRCFRSVCRYRYRLFLFKALYFMKFLCISRQSIYIL